MKIRIFQSQLGGASSEEQEGSAPSCSQDSRDGSPAHLLWPSQLLSLPHPAPSLQLLPTCVWTKHSPCIFSFSAALPQAEKKTNSKDSKSRIFSPAQEVNYQFFSFSQQPVFCVKKTDLINLLGVYAGEVIFQFGKVVEAFSLRFFSKVISSNTLNLNSITKQIYLS